MVESWNDSGLPWIVFWLKEIITWGTFDPVAAYLLSKSVCKTRKDALLTAEIYYTSITFGQDAYDAVLIRNWVESEILNVDDPSIIAEKSYLVTLLRDFKNSIHQQWIVYPIKSDTKTVWMDPAGYEFAISDTNIIIDGDEVEFILSPNERKVIARSYLNNSVTS